MENDLFSIIEEFKEFSPPRVILAKALKELNPLQGSKIMTIVALILAGIVAFWEGFSEETVALVSRTSSLLIEIQLAVFGCIFAVCSFVITLLSDDYIARLARIKDKDDSNFLKKTVEYYESVLLLFFINIGLSGVLLIMMKVLPPESHLCQSALLNSTIASLLLLIYYSYSFRVFCEVKSVIYNTFVLFKADIAYKLLDLEIKTESENVAGEEARNP